MKRLILTALIISVLFALSACGKSEFKQEASEDSMAIPEKVESLEIYLNAESMIEGDSQWLRAAVDDNIFFYSKDLAYTSSDPSIAEIDVSKQGECYYVKAKKAGTAEITVEAGGAKAVKTITVLPADLLENGKVTPETEEITLAAFGKETVKLQLSDAAADAKLWMYYDPVLRLGVEGSIENGTATLTISDAVSLGDGQVTFLLVEGDTITGAAHVNIKIK